MQSLFAAPVEAPAQRGVIYFLEAGWLWFSLRFFVAALLKNDRRRRGFIDVILSVSEGPHFAPSD